MPLLYAPTVGVLLAAGDNRRRIACSLSSVRICDLEDRYAAWPENRPHDPPHAGRTPDAHPVAAFHNYPRGVFESWADSALAGGWPVRGPGRHEGRDHPALCVQVGQAFSARWPGG